MTKKALTKKIKEISIMNKKSLLKFAQDLSLSLLEDSSKMFLNRAIDLRYVALQGVDVSGMVVMSELRSGEL